MITQNTRSGIVGRRGELLAELFLQEFDPIFLSRPTSDDVGFDLLVGFANEKSGTNTFAVQVKATEQPVPSRYRLPRSVLNRMARSNIPGLLLVADAKRNRLYYAWLTPSVGHRAGDVISIPVTEINETRKEELRKRFTSAEVGVAVAG